MGPAGAQTTFVGCFINNGGKARLRGHIDNKSFQDCAKEAGAAGKQFFGMEYPQGFPTPGNAQCLPLVSVPQQSSKVPDAECATEKDASGNYLGNAYRLAVYTLSHTQAGGCLSVCVCV